MESPTLPNLGYLSEKLSMSDYVDFDFEPAEAAVRDRPKQVKKIHKKIKKEDTSTACDLRPMPLFTEDHLRVWDRLLLALPPELKVVANEFSFHLFVISWVEMEHCLRNAEQVKPALISCINTTLTSLGLTPKIANSLFKDT